MHETHTTDYCWLVVRGAGDAWRGVTAVADHAVFIAGRLVLRPLVAAFSSLALHRSWFGSYLRHWQTYRALPKGAKPKAVALIVVTFAISIYFVPLLWVRILLVCMMFALLIMMWRLPVVDLEQ